MKFKLIFVLFSFFSLQVWNHCIKFSFSFGLSKLLIKSCCTLHEVSLNGGFKWVSHAPPSRRSLHVRFANYAINPFSAAEKPKWSHAAPQQQQQQQQQWLSVDAGSLWQGTGWGEEVERGEPQQMMCVHKNRALFNFKWPQAGKSFS